MINRILPFLNQFIPTALAAKGLGKIDPRFSNFFSSAAAAGYGTDAAIGFLRNKLRTPSAEGEQDRLEQGASQGTLRPDEAASLQRVKHSQAPANFAQKAIAGLTGLAAGSAGVPTQRNRPDVTEGPGIQPNPQSQARTYDPLAALKKHPELAKFIQKEASSGGNAESITAKARKQHKLADIVKSIESEIQEPFESLLGRLIGQQRQGSQSAQQNGASPAMSEFMAAMQQYKSIMAGRNGRGV